MEIAFGAKRGTGRLTGVISPVRSATALGTERRSVGGTVSSDAILR